MTGETVDKGERQLGQHAHIEVDHLQLLVAVARAGKTYQAKAGIVDDKLRLVALRRQTLADQMRGAGLEKIGCNDDRPTRSSRGNFIRQRIQFLFSSRDQCQFVAVARKDPRQRQTNSRRGSGDQDDRAELAHWRC